MQTADFQAHRNNRYLISQHQQKKIIPPLQTADPQAHRNNR